MRKLVTVQLAVPLKHQPANVVISDCKNDSLQRRRSIRGQGVSAQCLDPCMHDQVIRGITEHSREKPPEPSMSVSSANTAETIDVE